MPPGFNSIKGNSLNRFEMPSKSIDRLKCKSPVLTGLFFYLDFIIFLIRSARVEAVS